MGKRSWRMSAMQKEGVKNSEQGGNWIENIQ